MIHWLSWTDRQQTKYDLYCKIYTTMIFLGLWIKFLRSCKDIDKHDKPENLTKLNHISGYKIRILIE